MSQSIRVGPVENRPHLSMYSENAPDQFLKIPIFRLKMVGIRVVLGSPQRVK